MGQQTLEKGKKQKNFTSTFTYQTWWVGSVC